MTWVIGIVIYLILAFLCYKYYVNKWDMPKWEKIAVSISWICIIPVYIIRKIQELV